jgi:hypothetical protein
MLKYLLLILSLLSTAVVVGGCVGGSRPNIHHYSVDTSKIISGNTVWLNWDVEGADSVTLDKGIGSVPARGRMEVKPVSITAYNLTATNQHGMIVSALIINVVPVVQVASPPGARCRLGHAGATTYDYDSLFFRHNNLRCNS